MMTDQHVARLRATVHGCADFDSHDLSDLLAERDRLRSALVQVRGMVANSMPPVIERLDVGACLRTIDEVLR